MSHDSWILGPGPRDVMNAIRFDSIRFVSLSMKWFFTKGSREIGYVDSIGGGG